MEMTRRGWMGAAGALAAGALAGAQDEKKVVKKGKLKQGACLWCWQSRKVTLLDLCKAGAEMGLACIDLVGPKEWKVVQDHGLAVSTGMVGAGGINEGLNEPKHHDTIVRAFEANLPKAKEAGVRNVICFFGKRNGMSDAEGIDHSIACLNRVKAVAEENKVAIVIEILNSKVDHKDYIGDRTPYCLAILRAVNSPYVKLLYDIYHAQIMEGDVIRTIRDHAQWIGHYHTGGNPGRAEIDETQELQYVPISRAVVKTAFAGYYCHEFIPKKADPIQSLREAVALCDVE
jgi:hydroxypyruvate isomerase